MTLFLQDPFESDPSYLDETIFEACHNARCGGAMFAFASSAGAKLLLEDNTFTTFAAKNSFDLIVGVDAVTNLSALKALGDASKIATALTVTVFLNARTDALFHPKFCWFRHKRGGLLIAGSGNLTLGGLRCNWEAFSVTTLTASQVDAVEARWNDWKIAQTDSLLPPTDSRVLARASENSGWVNILSSEKRRGEKARPGKSGGDEETAVGPIRDNSSVLIAEIPKGGNRWTSAGFDLKNYEGFFGAKVGTQRRVVLQHVDLKGALGALESRPSVAVKSHNYRFELGAASGLPYPTKGAPVAVFVKVAPRTFRYRLLMPSDRDYRLIDGLLAKNWSGSSTEMRRIRMNLSELRAAWPKSPFWPTK
jgi:hypothetical protein